MTETAIFEPGGYRYVRGPFQYSGGVAAEVLRGLGLSPDVVICRSLRPLEAAVRGLLSEQADEQLAEDEARLGAQTECLQCPLAGSDRAHTVVDPARSQACLRHREASAFRAQQAIEAVCGPPAARIINPCRRRQISLRLAR